MVTLNDIREAQQRLRNITVRTELIDFAVRQQVLDRRPQALPEAGKPAAHRRLQVARRF